MGVGEDLRRDEGGETVIRIYCVTKIIKKITLTTFWLSSLLYNLLNVLLWGTHRMNNVTTHILSDFLHK